MIIQCGPDRRIASYTYGWKIEKRAIVADGKNKGAERWDEDRPAYPASLEQALQMVWERELKANQTTDISEVAEHARQALKAVQQYRGSAGRLAK